MRGDRDDSDDGKDLRKPFLNTGSWYRMGSRQSSIIGSSTLVMRHASISALFCVLIVALGPIQFVFTCGYSSPTQESIISDLKLSLSEFFFYSDLYPMWGDGGSYSQWSNSRIHRTQRGMTPPFYLWGGYWKVLALVPVYIAEISPQNMTGTLGSVNQLFITIGIMLAYLLGLFVNWRALAVLGILLCTVLIPGLFFIPESPRWLAKMGMTEEFETSLQVLQGFDRDISVEVHEIKIRGINGKESYYPVCRSQDEIYWYPLMVGIGLLVLQQLSGTNGVLFYSSTIFANAGISSSNTTTVGLGAIQVIATAMTTWLVDKSGRRLLLIISSSAMTVSLLVVSIAFYTEGYTSEDSHLYSILGIVSVVGVVTMVIGYSLGIGPITWLIMSEILPVNIKGLAGSIATLTNWLTSWVITMTANLLLAWSSGVTFTIYTTVAAFTVAFAAIWVPETKGRTLEEIQFSFRQICLRENTRCLSGFN